jgi:hypothetical protein
MIARPPVIDTIATPPAPTTATLADVLAALTGIRTELADALHRLVPGAPQWLNTNALTSSLFVKAIPGILYSVSGFNNNAAVRYIQTFDVRGDAGVPGNGVIPLGPVVLAAGSASFSLDFGARGQEFKYGILVVCSTTGPTLTIAGNDMWCSARFL